MSLTFNLTGSVSGMAGTVSVILNIMDSVSEMAGAIHER